MAIRPTSRSWSSTAVAIALWPALFPMWFVELGRLGNDSLVALLAGLTAILIPRTVLQGGWRHHLSLGVVCALGLLTKATFIPLVAAIIAFLCYRTWVTRHQHYDFRRFASGLAIFALTCIVVAGWWYISNLYLTGACSDPRRGALEQQRSLAQSCDQENSHRSTTRLDRRAYRFSHDVPGRWSLVLCFTAAGQRLAARNTGRRRRYRSHAGDHEWAAPTIRMDIPVDASTVRSRPHSPGADPVC